MSKTEAETNQIKQKPMPGEFNDSKHGILWNIVTTKDILLKCENFQFRHTDVIVATFPKSGTTLMQEILWLIHNQLDAAKALESPIYIRVPFLEVNMYEEDPFGFSGSFIDYINDIPVSQTRLIKTHLPLSYLRENLDFVSPKVIYVMRNPKDTMVSYYHFYKGVDDFGPWGGTFNEFFDMWMSGSLVMGNWFDVVAQWYAQREKPNFLMMFYEDILANPHEQIQKVAKFCGYEMNSDQLDFLVAHTRFDKMRDNPSTNYSTMPGINLRFMRKGQVGDWKNYFTVSQNEYFDKVMEEKYRDVLPTFRYE